MAGDDDRDSRRKHRRSNSSDEEDADKSSSSKRHKHRHKHRHHRHRHSTKRREEEGGKVYADDIEALPPPPPPPPPPQDVEEGEILDDSGVRDDAVLKTEEADDSGAESGEIEEAHDRSNKPNPGIYGDGTDDIRSPVVPKSLNEARDSSVHANGNLDMKRHRESRSPSNRSDRRKKYSDDEKLDVDRSKDKSSHRNSGGKDVFHRRSRSRSSNDRVRERSRSRSIMEEEAITKRRRYNERETYAEKSKAAHSDDERMVRDDEREHCYGRYSGLDRTREREKSREREVDRVRRKEKELERSRGRDPRRENERERSSDRDLVRDRKRVTDWESRREERHRSRDRDNRDRREDETDKNRDRTKVSDRDRVMDRHRDRDRVADQKWETRDDRYRDKGRDKYENLEDRYRNRDRNNHSARSRHDEKEHKQEGSAKSDPEKDQLKRDEDEEEDNEETMVPLQSADQEEEDLNRIKEESRRRKQAILEKYKSLQSQSQLQSQQEPQLPVQQQIDSENDHGGQSTEAASRAEITNGKSDGEVYVAESSLPTTTGQNGTMRLGEGTPKSETPDGLDKTKERSDGILCDDIFGETPTGVRKSGKGDALRIERSGLRDNWDDADGYYSYRFGELLDGRYEITAAHGKGVFSTVVRAKNLKVGNGEPEEVAIKIIRSNDTMYKAGMTELAILKKLVGQDPDNKRYCVRFLSSFKYRNHLCLVFESLHMNLRELLKKFGRNIGLKLTAVRIYAKQLLVALKHLKNCGVLHCDIKPDNMLVNEAKNVLKLCDFGNAMFSGKNEVTPYLVSRFYRAPEIILGLPYDHPLDIWSVGCCLFELYTGKVLFPGATNNDMLRLHMELKGPFPKKMLRKGAFTCQNFDQDLNFHATEDDPVTKKTIKRVILNIKPKDIGSMIAGSPGEDPDPKILADFKDLLDKMFVLDPDKRLTVSQGLNHPFITGK